MLLQLAHVGLALFVLALAELNLEVLELNLLVQAFELAVVAHIVLLLLIFLDLFVVLVDLGQTALVGGLGLLDFGGEVVDTRVQTGNLVLKVLHSLRQLAADDTDFVYLAVYALQGVECHEAFLNRHVGVRTHDDGSFLGFRFGFFGADFLCHIILYIIVPQSNILNNTLLGLRNSACKVTKFFRYRAENNIFCELLALIVTDIGQHHASVGALEVVVFQVGGEVDVGSSSARRL